MESEIQNISDIRQDKDYFRVANIIRRLEACDDPEISKLKILASEGKKIFKEFGVELEENKIKALKYNADKDLWGYAEMSENDVLKQIGKAQALYKHKELVDNLSILAMHYKKVYQNSKHYEPFFDYCLNLIERILNSEKVAGNTDLKTKIEELNAELVQKETKLEDTKVLLKECEAKIISLKQNVVASIIDSKMLRIFNKIYTENINNQVLVALLVYLNANGGTSSVELLKKGFDKKDINTLAKDYPELIIKDGNELKINYEFQDSTQIKEEAFKEAEKIADTKTLGEKLKNLIRIK